MQSRTQDLGKDVGELVYWPDSGFLLGPFVMTGPPARVPGSGSGAGGVLLSSVPVSSPLWLPPFVITGPPELLPDFLSCSYALIWFSLRNECGLAQRLNSTLNRPRHYEQLFLSNTNALRAKRL